MKTLHSIMLILAITLAGCGTPQKTAYTTLATIGATVDAAMHVAAAAKVAGKISDADWQKIAAKHAQYLPAYNSAIDIASGSTSGYAPADLIAIETDLVTTINTLTK